MYNHILSSSIEKGGFLQMTRLIVLTLTLAIIASGCGQSNKTVETIDSRSWGRIDSGFESLADDLEQKLNTSNMRYSHRIAAITVESDGWLYILMMGNDNLSTNMKRRSMLSDALTVLLETAPRVTQSTLVVGIMFPMLDKYGNSSTEIYGLVRIERSEVLKINRNNFLVDDLPRIAMVRWN